MIYNVLPWAVFAVVTLFSGAVLWVIMRFAYGSIEKQKPELLTLRSPGNPVGSTGKFDQFFSRFVDESGISLHPTIIMLLIVGTSLLTGMTLFVFFENPLISFLGVLGMLILMITGLMIMRSKYQTRIMDQLPDVIEMLSRAVRAGQSFEQALRAVALQSSSPLSIDLKRGVQKLDLGLSVPDTLRQLEKRHRLFDVRMFVSAVAIHRQAGGDLAATLDRLSLVSRERMAYRRKLKSMMSSARLAATLIALATPCLLLYYAFQKDYIGNLLLEPSGQFYLLLAIGLELLGIVWLFALSRSEI